MKILLCSEGTERSRNAIQLGLRIASATKSEVTIFGITELESDEITLLEALPQTQRALLASSSVLGHNLRSENAMIEAGGISTEVRVRSGVVHVEIAAEIESGDYDLVVLGSKPSRDVFSDYLLGNMTRRLVNWVSRPVLVVASEIPNQRPRSWLERITGRAAQG